MTSGAARWAGRAVRVLAVAGAVLIAAPAAADEADHTAVQQALEERTEILCHSVLPLWFSTVDGSDSATVRRAIVDCYLSHARLSLLGSKKAISFDGIALTELPAALLRHEYGFDLDIYRPLAGRRFSFGPEAQ